MCFESRGDGIARRGGSGRARATTARHCNDLAGGCAGNGPTQPDTVASGCSGPLAIVLEAMFLGREYEGRVDRGIGVGSAEVIWVNGGC